MIQIIPAIDLIDGKCVRLSQGDFSKRTIYSDDPLWTAKDFEAAGLRRLHIVDLDGARTGKLTNLTVLETIARNTNLTIDFGGGIETNEDLKSVFDAGAAIASTGSVAVKSPERFFAWVERYGGEKMLLNADARSGKVLVDGWQTVTELEIIPFLREYFTKGVRQVVVTDTAKDGLLKGPSVGLYKEIRQALPELKLTASGGVSRLEDIDELERIGCDSVIVGKAIYEGKISPRDLADRQEHVTAQT